MMIIIKKYMEDTDTIDYVLNYTRTFHVPVNMQYEGIDDYCAKSLIDLAHQDLEMEAENYNYSVIDLDRGKFNDKVKLK